MKKKLITMKPKEIAMVILPLIIVSVYICISFSILTDKLVKENIEDKVSSSMKQAELSAKCLLLGEISSLNTIVNVAGSSKDADTIDAVQKIAAKQHPNATFYFVTAEPLNSKGYLLMSDDWKAPKTFNQFERPWYIDAVNAKGNYAGNVYLNTRVNKNCIAMSKAVYDNNGKLFGVAGFDIYLDVFSESVNQIMISENSTVHIVLKDGTYMTHKDPGFCLNKNYFEESKIIPNNITAATYLDGSLKYNINGKNYFSTSKLPESPWFIVAEGPLSDFTGSIRTYFTIIIIVSVILILVCLILNGFAMEKIKGKERILGSKLYGETQNLVVAAKENAATSQDQSAAVKEIVATMEDNNDLSESISTKIKDVSSVANKTSDDVTDGVAALAKNVEKLHEIFEANQNTIDGIKSLGEKIENIWDIVTLINSVADQAKIIAFNAELEASSAGEAGKNFHIVASEIRRLADGIIDGTKEIKEKINEIQQSSDSLILASESGTEKINAGCENAKELEAKFESIKNASEITAGSASDITSIIQQQTIASEQILITLKQIAAGVENFTQATENISSSAQNVQIIAEELNESEKNSETV